MAALTLSLALVLSVGQQTSSASTASGRFVEVRSAPVGTTVTGLFGRRYCELILVNAHSSPITAQVWNTYPLNNCPEDKWTALDPAAVAAQRGSAAALRNGPRYWAVDSITKFHSAPLPTATLGLSLIHI